MVHFLVRKILRKFSCILWNKCAKRPLTCQKPERCFQFESCWLPLSNWPLQSILITVNVTPLRDTVVVVLIKMAHKSVNFFWFLAMMKGFVQIHFPNLNFFNSLEPYVLLSCFSCSRQYPHDELVISHSTSSCHSHNCTPNSSGCNYCVTITGYFCCSSLALCCSACQGVLHRSLKLGMGANFGPPVHLCYGTGYHTWCTSLYLIKIQGEVLWQKHSEVSFLFIVFCILMKEALYCHNFRSCFSFKYSKGKVGLWLKTVV